MVESVVMAEDSTSPERPGYERRMYRDRRLPPEVIEPLAAMRPRVRSGQFWLVHTALGEGPVPALGEPMAEGVVAAFRSGDEIQWVVGETSLEALKAWTTPSSVEGGYRIITLSPIPEDTECAFSLTICGMLLDSRVNARVYWGDSSLELLVKGRALKNAREALELLISRVKGRYRKG